MENDDILGWFYMLQWQHIGWICDKSVQFVGYRYFLEYNETIVLRINLNNHVAHHTCFHDIRLQVRWYYS